MMMVIVETFTLEDKSEYEDEIKLKVISRLLIKYTPEKLNCTFLSE